MVKKYKVTADSFFMNKTTGQYSIFVPAGKIKRMLGLHTQKNISKLIVPIGAVIYFKKLPPEPDHTISKEEQEDEFEDEEGINFG